MLPKSWRRIDGKVLLYKGGTEGFANTGNEPYSEYYAAQIAQTMGINAITYNLSKWKGKLCSTCELFTSRETAFIPAGRLVPSGGMPAVLKYFQQLGEPFFEAISDMLVFDAVVCNQDRHLGNFGVLIDSHTNNIIASAPLFDHGLSLFPYAMEDDLKDISTYATAMRPATCPSFMAMAKEVITPRQKEQLRKLANF